jgi:hypothetical protein
LVWTREINLVSVQALEGLRQELMGRAAGGEAEVRVGQGDLQRWIAVLNHALDT